MFSLRTILTWTCREAHHKGRSLARGSFFWIGVLLCFLHLLIVCSSQSALNEPTVINLIDPELTTGYTLLDPRDGNTNGNFTSVNNSDPTNETTTSSTVESDSNSTHVNLFLDASDEPRASTITNITTPTTTPSEASVTTVIPTATLIPLEITPRSKTSQIITTISPLSEETEVTTLSPTTIIDLIEEVDSETATTATFNLNLTTIQTFNATETPEPTTLLTIDLVTTISGPTVLSSDLDNNTIAYENLTSISSTISDQSVGTNRTGRPDCVQSNRNNTKPTNEGQSSALDSEARKFFYFTMILLVLCCLLILIVLILVAYVYRRVARERKVKIITNGNNNNGNQGAIEFDTIKDGRFYQWQSNVNNAFDASDLTEPTGYRFLEGAVAPYSQRYDDLKTSTIETFRQSQSLAIDNISGTASTVDTRL